jgi:multidrug efflux pump subunit AcrA (membrane-fusion protein)
VRVALRLPRDPGRLEIPSEAVLQRGDKTFAAVVEGGRVRLVTLVLGDDVGSRVRVLRGLEPGLRVIRNPNPNLKDGDRVQVLD